MPYPNGADALLIALQTPAPKQYMGIPVLIWGAPGIGKSSFLEALASPNFPIVTLIAAIHDPTDFSGLPIFDQGKVHYAVPEWVSNFGNDGAGLLFLDELSTAPPVVQAALLRVVLERKVGFQALPPKVRIVAAANPPDHITGGWELSPPLCNRFVHIEWSLPPATFIHALEHGYTKAEMPAIDPQAHAARLSEWQLRVLAFLKRMPQYTATTPQGDVRAFATPRTWDFAIALMTSCDLLGKAPNGQQKGDPVFYELLRGCVGESVAIPFAEFLESLKLPDPQQILSGKVKVNIKKLNDSEVFILFAMLNTALFQRYDEPDFHESVEHYLSVAQDVFKDGRRDIIYISLKKAAKNNFLIKAAIAAKRYSAESRQKNRDAINEIFSDIGLNEFIEIFEDHQ